MPIILSTQTNRDLIALARKHIKSALIYNLTKTFKVKKMNRNIVIGSIFAVILTTNTAIAGSDNSSGGSKNTHTHSSMQMNNQPAVEINTQPFIDKKEGTEAWHGHSSTQMQQMSYMMKQAKDPNHHETSVSDYYSIDFMSDK